MIRPYVQMHGRPVKFATRVSGARTLNRVSFVLLVSKANAETKLRQGRAIEEYKPKAL